MRRALLPALGAAAAALLVPALPAGATSPNIVFFASGSARLDPSAERMLDAAMQWFRYVGATRIRIDAAADRVGSSDANRRLSWRRAVAVRDALVRRGFPPGRISIRVLGEDQPLVETADGVEERSNRYAYISIEDTSPGPAVPAPPPR
jgi:outer membrane protein OmpA-like peptidoglycan-associated protein